MQFVLFLLVLVLVARVSRRDDASAARASRSRRASPPVPERLREIWWVRRHAAARRAASRSSPRSSLPLLVRQVGTAPDVPMILAFALCAVSVAVLTGWGGQLSLGQMAFAGLGALDRGRARPRACRSTSAGTTRASSTAASPAIAVPVGAPARRVRRVPRRGARRRRRAPRQRAAARDQHARVRDRRAGVPLRPADLHRRPARPSQLPRGDLGPLDLTHLNRAYYYFVLVVLVRRAAARRAPPPHRDRPHDHRRARERARGGRADGLARRARSSPRSRSAGSSPGSAARSSAGDRHDRLRPNAFFRVEDSLTLVAIAVIGGLGSLAGAVIGALWVVGLPAFWPEQRDSCRCSRRASGC